MQDEVDSGNNHSAMLPIKIHDVLYKLGTISKDTLALPGEVSHAQLMILLLGAKVQALSRSASAGLGIVKENAAPCTHLLYQLELCKYPS